MSSHSQDLFMQPGTPAWPCRGSLAGQVLHRLVAGEHLTQISFGTAHWRLAAYVNRLRNLGWDVRSSRVRVPGRPGTIARYWLTQSAAASSIGNEQLTLRFALPIEQANLAMEGPRPESVD
ncbi:protein of unknown function [Pararobbsia alpina]